MNAMDIAVSLFSRSLLIHLLLPLKEPHQSFSTEVMRCTWKNTNWDISAIMDMIPEKLH